MGDCFEISALIVQIALAGLAAWYAWETRTLRLQDKAKMQQAEVQIEIMRRQDLRSIQPLCILASYYTVQSDAQSIFPAETVYAINMFNIRPGVALNAMVCGYDPVNKNFFKTLGDDWIILGNAPQSLAIDNTKLSQGELHELLNKKFGQKGVDLLNKCQKNTEADAGYAMAICRDIDGNLHATKRVLVCSFGMYLLLKMEIL